MVRLKLSEVCGDSLVFRNDAARLLEAIERHWSQDGVAIDFEDRRIASISFLDEGLAKLALSHTLPEIRAKVTLVNMTEPDRSLLGALLLQRDKERAAPGRASREIE